MDTPKRTFEHPFVTRVKSVTHPPLSPVLTASDDFQPSHGCIRRRTCVQEFPRLALV